MKCNLNIGAYKWEFNDQVEEIIMDHDLGLCDYEKLTISIKEGINEQVRKATVLHELGHAFFSSIGFDPKEEERIVDITANMMLDFIERNKEFFKNYFLDDTSNT